MKTPESGARLEYINFKGVYRNLAAGFSAEFILYVKVGNNKPSSTIPIADYLDNSVEPPTSSSIDIRKYKLKYQLTVMPTNASFPCTFSYRAKLRKPITFNQNTTLILGVRTGDVSKDIIWQAYYVFRK